MDTLAKISELLRQKNKTQKDLTDFLGLVKNAFTDWKSGKSSSYKKYISQIAEYLDVSADYLLGTEQKENRPPISERSRLIINELDNLTESEAEAILKQIEIIKSLRSK